MLENGLDNVNEESINFIAELANKCPYQEGSAVYKARGLNAMFNPTVQYDDIKICNNVGVYKNSNESNANGLFGSENSYLKNLKAKESQLLTDNDVKVYPNPANTSLNIAYNIRQDVQFVIVDLLGRILLNTTLSKDANHALININSLQYGVYIYKMINDSIMLKTGKLIIE